MHAIIQSANHTVAVQRRKSCGYFSGVSVNVHINNQNEEKKEISVILTWLLVPEVLVWVFLKTADLGVLILPRGQRRMVRAVQADRKARLTQITTLYNCGEQRSFSESTTHPTLRWMSHNSRRSCLVPLLSSKNINLRPQWTQTHQNWTAEDVRT